MAPIPALAEGGLGRLSVQKSCPGATRTPCPPGTFVFQDVLRQGQQLCGKDEEDGEFSLCLCPSPRGRGPGGWGREAGSTRGETGGQARTFSSLQSPEAVLRGPEGFRCLLDVYLLNQPHRDQLLPPTPGLSPVLLPSPGPGPGGYKPHTAVASAQPWFSLVLMKYFMLRESTTSTRLKSQTLQEEASLLLSLPRSTRVLSLL